MSAKRALLGVLVAIVLGLALWTQPGIHAAPSGGPQPVALGARIAPPGADPASSGTTIPYTGRLTDPSGQVAADGLYDLRFALYRTETGGQPVWSEGQEGVQVLRGELLTSLGAAQPIPAAVLAGGGTQWLAVSIRGPGEAAFTALAPRQRLTAAAPAPAAASTSAACPHDHVGETWVVGGSGNGLWIEAQGAATAAVRGANNYGTGVSGYSTFGTGVGGSSGGGVGVSGESTYNRGVYGISEDHRGVEGNSDTEHGVYGETGGDWSYRSGVYGLAQMNHANAVTGWNSAGGPGVYGYSETGKAGYFAGDLQYTGSLIGPGSRLLIDHPLKPEDKYLYHASVHSPDDKTVYDGIVLLDAAGAAWVELPDWFEALNGGFRYQLTPVGGAAPGLHIAQEIVDNRFQIAGGEPGLKVSWQVTGVRRDAYAQAHPLAVEEAKPPEEQGTYLYPAEHGQPLTAGLEYRRNTPPELRETGGQR